MRCRIPILIPNTYKITEVFLGFFYIFPTILACFGYFYIAFLSSLVLLGFTPYATYRMLRRMYLIATNSGTSRRHRHVS